MKGPASTNAELALALPLGVVANQLAKVEAELRFLSAKAGVHAQDGEAAGPVAQIAARLEQINETIEAIRGLVADLEADLQPGSAQACRRARQDRDD